MNYEPREIFFKGYLIPWINSQGESEIEYVKYLESNNKEMLKALLDQELAFAEEHMGSEKVEKIIEKNMGKTWEEINET